MAAAVSPPNPAPIIAMRAMRGVGKVLYINGVFELCFSGFFCKSFFSRDLLGVLMGGVVMSVNDLEIRFFEVFPNLPSGIRKEIVVVLDKEPYTWQSVYFEVLGKTDKAALLLQQLARLDII